MGFEHESAGDHELLRASASDPAAFEELFARHAAPMRRWLAGRVHDTAVANDLLAETFAQAWRARRTFSGDDARAGTAWLFGIARNLLRQHYKRGRVETAARRKLGMSTRAPHDDQLDEVVARLDAEAPAGRLGRALLELPDAQRRAVAGRVVRQHGYEKLASELDCSRDNARAHVSRGLRALGAILKGAHP
jgi:RNA polymerase sigma factor (sigma-70 family)